MKADEDAVTTLGVAFRSRRATVQYEGEGTRHNGWAARYSVIFGGETVEMIDVKAVEHYLCCNCGGIAPGELFAHFVRDEETGEWREPAPREDYSDPMLKCPMCEWEHTDDDANPGLYQGPIPEMRKERAELLSDPLWAETWTDTRKERGWAGALDSTLDWRSQREP